MSFWKDASPVVRGAIIFGVLALMLLVGMQFFDDGGAEAVPAGGAESAAP